MMPGVRIRGMLVFNGEGCFLSFPSQHGVLAKTNFSFFSFLRQTEDRGLHAFGAAFVWWVALLVAFWDTTRLM